jgi:hypothetical protein
MPTITVDATYQGIITRSDIDLGAINWSTTRDAGSGTTSTTYTTANDGTGILISLGTGRAGINQSIIRTFLFFDLDSIPTEAKGNITSATLKVLGGNFGSADSIPVKASAWGDDGGTSTLSTGNFSALTFATPYSSEKTSWTTSGYNDYTLNSDAIDDINTSNPASLAGSTYRLNVVVIEHDYDYSNVTPPNPTSLFNNVRFLDATNKIKLEITYPDPGYGNTVIGVAPANIGSVIGVGTGAIETVIGV